MPKFKLGGVSSRPPSPPPSTSRAPGAGASSPTGKRPRTDEASGASPAKKQKTEAAGQEKDTTTESRLKRAYIRDKRRLESSSAVAAQGGSSSFRDSALELARLPPKNTPKTQLNTPFGPVNASRFPTSDPAFKITTQAKNYGKQPVKDRYSDLVPALKAHGASDKDIATDLLRGLKDEKPQHITADKEKNGAAKLVGITHVSERQRVPGSDKAARGVLRMVQDGKLTLDEAFKGDTPAFPMAKNPDYMRRTVNYEDKNYRKPIDKPTKFKELGGYMSSSSDEEG